MATVTVHSDFGDPPPKYTCQCFHFFPFYLPWSDGTRCHDLSLLNIEFQASFFNLLFPLIKRLRSSSSFSAIRVRCHLHIWGCWYFFWQSWFQLEIHPAQHFTWYTLHTSSISRVTMYSLDVLFSQFWTSPLFHVLTWIQVSQEAGKVV